MMRGTRKAAARARNAGAGWRAAVRLALVAATTAAAAGCGERDRTVVTPPAFQSPLVGQPIPEIDIREWVIDPGPDLRAKEAPARVILFWNFTDPTSREALEFIQSLAVPLHHRGLRVVLIHTDIGIEENPRRDRISGFLDGNGFMMPAAIDNGTATLRRFGLTDVPSLVFVDDASVVRGVVANYRTSKNDVIAEFVRTQLLGMPPALPES